jgi:hypothetical protein
MLIVGWAGEPVQKGPAGVGLTPQTCVNYLIRDPQLHKVNSVV